MAISNVLNAMAAISRFWLIPSRAPLILKVNSKQSMKTPKRKVKKNVNGPSAGLPRAVSKPPTAPT